MIQISNSHLCNSNSEEFALNIFEDSVQHIHAIIGLPSSDLSAKFMSKLLPCWHTRQKKVAPLHCSTNDGIVNTTFAVYSAVLNRWRWSVDNVSFTSVRYAALPENNSYFKHPCVHAKENLFSWLLYLLLKVVAKLLLKKYTDTSLLYKRLVVSCIRFHLMSMASFIAQVTRSTDDEGFCKIVILWHCMHSTRSA